MICALCIDTNEYYVYNAYIYVSFRFQSFRFLGSKVSRVVFEVCRVPFQDLLRSEGLSRRWSEFSSNLR